jgi:hypothetical protein
MEVDVLSAALNYAAQGIRVLPLAGIEVTARPPSGIPLTRCRCGYRECPAPGKHPVIRDPLVRATTDEGQIRLWFSDHPNNIGLICGEGFSVLDVDSPSEWYWEMRRSVDPDLLSDFSFKDLQIRTGRGWHLYFRSAGDERLRSKSPHVDLLGARHYVVAPPSMHVRGRLYGADYARRGGPVMEWPKVVDPPPWLDAILERPTAPKARFVPPPEDIPDVGVSSNPRYAEAALNRACEEISNTREGQRNDKLYLEAFKLARFVVAGSLAPSVYASRLSAAGLACGLAEREVLATIKSGFDGWRKLNGGAA